MSDEVRLPFDEEQQQALMGHVIQDERFFLQVKDRIKADWFVDGYVQKVYRAYSEFWDRFHRVPRSTDELRGFDVLASLNPADSLKVSKAIERCGAASLKYGLDLLADQLTAWAKSRVALRDLPQVANLLNSRQVGAAESLLQKVAREIQTTRFDGAPEVDWSNPRALVESIKLDMEDALTTGIGILDRKLLPENVGKGALLRGDTTVLIAPVNMGKTTAMMTIARHNLAQKKNVLWISLEGRDVDLMQKMWCCTLRRTKEEFHKMVLGTDPAEQQMLDIIGAQLQDRLTYLPIHRSGVTVEEVVSIIRTRQNQRIGLKGKGYDLLVVDYPGVLTTELAKGGKLEERQSQAYIYRQFVQLALEERFHCLVAAQTNREGSKANRKGDRLLTLEDISEAFGIAMSATNSITLNRDETAMSANRATFYICKSRSSDTNWAVACRSDYSRSMTHGDALGGTAYRGSGTMLDRIESLLENYKGRDVPEGIIHG